MKYVLGFNTEHMYKEYKLGYKHVVILAWLEKFIRSGKSTTVKHDGKTFHWVYYDRMLQDCIMMDVRKQMLAVMFRECCAAGLLEHFKATFIPCHIPGTYSCYRFVDGILEVIKPSYTPPPINKEAAKARESQTPYQQYLLSSQWRNRRNIVLKRDKHKCTKCGSKEKLNVHHLSYEHVGDEPIEDLLTLCEACHKQVHGIEVS